jgi:pyruvate,water dikinase
MLLRPIDALLPRASRNYGCKARNLAALVRAGFPVPLAYGLPCEAAELTFARSLPRALQPAQLFAQPVVAERDLAEARERVLAADLHAELAHDLVRALSALRAASAESVAVRSSSTAEDQGAATIAGLNLSVLGVASEAALIDAVRQCFAQVFSPRVAHYLGSLGTEVAGSLGVVIQAMVPADVAGVLFTVNPLTGDRDEIVLDASYGLGPSATDGHATPDTYRIDKRSGWIRDRVIGDKRSRLVVSSAGTLLHEPMPLAASQKQALDEHMLAQLVALGQHIEDHFGDARGVEFAIAQDSIYVLDAWPLSAAAQRAALPRKRKKRLGSDASTSVWSSMGLPAVLPGVTPPLIWSVLSQFSAGGFRHAFAELGCKMHKEAAVLGNFRGRVYLNATELAQVAAQVPGLAPSAWLPRDAAAALALHAGDARPVSPAGFLLRLPRTASRLSSPGLNMEGRVAAFEAAFEAERARIEGLDLRIVSAAALSDTVSDVHRLLNEAGALALTAHGAFLGTLVPLRAALSVLKRDQADDVLHGLVTALSEPHPGALDRALGGVARPARPPLRALASIVRDHLRLRDRMYAYVRHALELLRLCARDTSRRMLVREPDVLEGAAFFLTLDELHAVLRGEMRTATSTVRLRRAQYERDRALPDPPPAFVGYPPPVQRPRS